MSRVPPLVYVHLGRRPLHGLNASITQGRRALPGGDILVVRETGAGPRIPRSGRALTITPPPPSPRTRAFEGLSRSDRGFRDGFWFHATRRLFVLADALADLGIDQAIHLEGDCLPLLEARDLEALRAFPDRLLLPASSATAAMAVLLWVGSRRALAAALEAMLEDLRGDPALNEMELLARAVLGSAPVEALPTAPDATWLKPYRVRSAMDAAMTRHFDAFGCIFDAAALGQYLGGEDPENAPERPLTLHVNPASAIDPRQLEWRIAASGRSIEVRSTIAGSSAFVRVANLHMHCKTFPPLEPSTRPWYSTRIAATSTLQPVPGSHPRRALLPAGGTRGWASSALRGVGGAVVSAGGLRAAPSEPIRSRVGSSGVRAMRRGHAATRRRPLSLIPGSGALGSRGQAALLDRILRADPLGHAPAASVPIAIAIPCGPRDVSLAPAAALAAIEAVAADVAGVRIVAADPAAIDRRRLPAGVEVVPEEAVIDATVAAAVARAVPRERAGWVLQQLVKLREATLGPAPATLVADADTLLLRPRNWLSGPDQIVIATTEVHSPYGEHLDRLLGSSRPRLPLSAVAHHQLMQRDVLQLQFGTSADSFSREALRFLEAARFGIESACSEYELYGALLLQASPWRCRLASPRAVTFSRSDVDWTAPADAIVAALRDRHPDAYSASSHWYAEALAD